MSWRNKFSEGSFQLCFVSLKCRSESFGDPLVSEGMVDNPGKKLNIYNALKFLSSKVLNARA